MNLAYVMSGAMDRAVASLEKEMGVQITSECSDYGSKLTFQAGNLGPFDTLPELRRAIIADRDEERLSRLYP